MNMKKPDLKKSFSNMKKNAARKAASMKKKKSVPFHGYTEGGKKAAPLRREGKLTIPIGVQTVLAVVICCGVLVLVGAGIITSQQMEVAELKSEIKTYVDDGVVPASAMNDSLSLNIESIGGRVEAARRMLDKAEDNALSNDDIQWLSLEISELQIESERLNDVLNAAEADKSLRKSFNETVQSPLVTLAETFETMTVNDSDIVDTSVENGAAASTGAFKVAGNLEKGIRWIVVIAIIAVLAVLAFLFRHKLGGLFRRKPQRGKAKAEAAAKGKAKAKAEPKAEAKGEPKQKKPAEAKGKKTTHDHPFAAETEAAEGEEIVLDDEEFLAAVTKMAENERKNAEEGTEMAEPSEEERISFDSNVATQEDIEEEDDPLFFKDEDRA